MKLTLEDGIAIEYVRLPFNDIGDAYLLNNSTEDSKQLNFDQEKVREFLQRNAKRWNHQLKAYAITRKVQPKLAMVDTIEHTEIGKHDQEAVEAMVKQLDGQYSGILLHTPTVQYSGMISTLKSFLLVPGKNGEFKPYNPDLNHSIIFPKEEKIEEPKNYRLER